MFIVCVKYLLVSFDAGVLPGGPHAHGQDEEIEDDDGNDSHDVDHFD